MSVSARSLLIPGVALAVAGGLALAPAMTSAPMSAPTFSTVAVPSIHIEEIQLAGVGREIYDSITNFVQYTVSSAEFWIDLIPVIGPPLADQLNINYFEGIQPLIAATVYFISDVIDNPLNFLQLAVDYGSNLFYTGYNWVSAQSQFFGLGGLPPIPVPPPLASVPPVGRSAAAVVGAVDAPVAQDVRETAQSTDVTESPTAAVTATSARSDFRGRAARLNVPGPRPAPAAAAVGAAADVPVAVAADAGTTQGGVRGAPPGTVKATHASARTDRASGASQPGQPRQ